MYLIEETALMLEDSIWFSALSNIPSLPPSLDVQLCL